ncbi:MAG: HAD family hydrolase [Eubacteriales bacterium]|nr:HAD family hydrolase [Eubacteriales bacterium]
MTYQLLATDIDGTLLNDKKEIPVENINAINHALDIGKTVVISSGRCVDECRHLFRAFPKMQYAICESGAYIYDIQNDQCIYSKQIDTATVETILNYIRTKDVMIQAMGHKHMVVSKKDMDQAEHFHIAQYRYHFQDNGSLVEDTFEFCKENNWYAEKICLYHTDAAEREITKKQFESLPVTLAYSEETSLEVSPLGIDKGNGLRILCEHLGIPLEQTIAVGDSYNDLQILKNCGLSVAVSNARDEIKEICDVIVADNNHAGVKEAIETYLLK